MILKRILINFYNYDEAIYNKIQEFALANKLTLTKAVKLLIEKSVVDNKIN